MYLTATSGGRTVTNTHDHQYSKGGDAGHYYVKAGAEVAIGTLNVITPGPVTITYSRQGGEEMLLK
jgi:hypothetical protein